MHRDELLARGIDLFNNRRYFECHEVWEELWTPERGVRRLFLQALIHFAVALYHRERHNPDGAIRQMRKGVRKLAAYLPACEGLDTGRLHRDGVRILAELEGGDAQCEYPIIYILAADLNPISRPTS
jgi:predicted metal-dependent hydrolase